MNAFSFLSARFRGVRMVTLAGWTLMLFIAVGSYTLKTFAGAEDSRAASVEGQIQIEQKRIRLLRAEISRLGAPERVGDLARQHLNLGPPGPGREITAQDLAVIAAAQARAPGPPLNQAIHP